MSYPTLVSRQASTDYAYKIDGPIDTRHVYIKHSFNESDKVTGPVLDQVMHFRIDYKSEYEDGRPPEYNPKWTDKYSEWMQLVENNGMFPKAGEGAPLAQLVGMSLMILSGAALTSIKTIFKRLFNSNPEDSTVPVPYKQVRFYFGAK
jgi:hypothetical protein